MTSESLSFSPEVRECMGKTRYSPDRVHVVAAELSTKRGYPLYAYQCPHCRSCHLTRSPVHPGRIQPPPSRAERHQKRVQDDRTRAERSRAFHTISNRLDELAKVWARLVYANPQGVRVWFLRNRSQIRQVPLK